MDVLTAIQTRASAVRLAEPGPTAAQLDIILSAGIQAPDHGRLSPWRFVVLSGSDRTVLATALEDMQRRKTPDAPVEEIERTGRKAMRAPTVVVVAARITPSPKIPDVEQIVAVAAGVQNMFLAAHGLGLGAMWKTGGAAYDPDVKAALGLQPSDQIVAYLYLGTPVTPGVPRQKKLDDFIIRR
jgi:nitroreductase